jgi:hypothetical protein
LGCFGGILAIAAIVTGVLGIRAAQQRQGKGKQSAVGGIVLAIFGVAVFLFVFISAMVTPGGLWAHVQATPTPLPSLTPSMTPTPTPTPTVTPEPTATPESLVHRGERFNITYTNEWEIYRDASESGSEYLIIGNPQGILIHVYQQTLSEKPDLESTAEVLLSEFESISMVEEREIEIDGQKGLAKRFVYQASGGQNHVLLVMVANEYDLYTILVEAPSQEIFTQYEAEAEAIINSIEFTSAGAPAAAPEPTLPASILPTPPPPTGYKIFSGDKFTLTYPEEWQEDEAFSSEGICAEATNLLCFALVYPTDEIRIHLMRYTIEQAITAEEADQAVWAELVAPAYDSVNLESFERNLEIDGRPAVKRVFSATRADLQEHVVYIVVTDGYDTYHFQGQAPSVEAFEQYQPIIEEIIFSLDFLE